VQVRIDCSTTTVWPVQRRPKPAWVIHCL